MRTLMNLVEAAGATPTEPYIDAHRSGDIIWIDMMWVPRDQRGKGVGRRYYEEWEAALPKDVTLVRLMAADTGSGMSNGFWEAMGFDYQYNGENLDYDASQYMWKGVNGHATPPTVNVDDEVDEAGTLREAPQAQMLYHGTSTKRARDILTAGLTPPSHWGTLEIAHFFAAQERRSSGGKAVIFAKDLTSFDTALLRVDEQMLEFPVLTDIAGADHGDLEMQWDESGHTWQDCLEIYGSVVYAGPVRLTREDML